MPQTLRQTLLSLRNRLDFALRSQLRFHRTWRGAVESKQNLFDDLGPDRRDRALAAEAALAARYDLAMISSRTSRRVYRTNLAMIELLERFVTVEQPDVRVLDVGAKNWEYGPGMYACFQSMAAGRTFRIDGIEIDAYRRYTDLHTRHDYATFYIAGLTGMRYLVGDLLLQSGTYTHITLFFPFLTPEPLLVWGLPISYLQPRAMMNACLRLLQPGGQLLIVNKSFEEYDLQGRLLDSLVIPCTRHGRFENSFIEFSDERWVTTVRKT